MDMEGGHKLVPLDEDVSLLFEYLSLIPIIYAFEMWLEISPKGMLIVEEIYRQVTIPNFSVVVTLGLCVVGRRVVVVLLPVPLPPPPPLLLLLLLAPIMIQEYNRDFYIV